MKHELDDGLPVFGESGDITDHEERYAFFESVVEENSKALRMERNRLLSETDWTQNEDIPQETRDIWKPYRQALRDITDNYTSLHDVVWPDKPL